jgi:hypothetical protein
MADRSDDGEPTESERSGTDAESTRTERTRLWNDLSARLGESERDGPDPRDGQGESERDGPRKDPGDPSASDSSLDERIARFRREMTERDHSFGETAEIGIRQVGRIDRPREFVALWTLALLTYGVGDLVTTGVAVLYVPGVLERNPVIDTILRTAGMAGFVAAKAVIFLFLVSISVNGAQDGEPFAYYAPVVAAILLGTALTGWNLLQMSII